VSFVPYVRALSRRSFPFPTSLVTLSRIPFNFNILHTPDFGISVTLSKETTSTLFGKLPGVYPEKRTLSETSVSDSLSLLPPTPESPARDPVPRPCYP